MTGTCLEKQRKVSIHYILVDTVKITAIAPLSLPQFIVLGSRDDAHRAAQLFPYWDECIYLQAWNPELRPSMQTRSKIRGPTPITIPEAEQTIALYYADTHICTRNTVS